MRKLASIQKIIDIQPIPDADAIEVATVNGWKVVVKKNDFKIGDLIIYCEIDSFIPNVLAPQLTKPGKEPSVYNGVLGERLRTIKLRSQISQGFILPISVFQLLPESKKLNLLTNIFDLDTDVTEELGIQKWEPVIPAQLQGQIKGNFPSWARKTDQERIESIPNEVFVDNRDSRYEITLKLDGSSCSVYFKDGLLGVCSRNLDLKMNEENQDNSFIKTSTKTKLLSVLEKYGKNIMVQSELLGPGIQGNREQLKDFQLFVFDIFDIDKHEYLNPVDRMNVFDDLKALGFTGEHCPIIALNTTLKELDVTDVQSSKVYVDKPSINSHIAEGYVFKRMDGKFSFKSINNKFLLKYE